MKLPVLTAVAKIIDNELTPTKAVLELMNLPQVDSKFPRLQFQLGYISGFDSTIFLYIPTGFAG